MTEKKENFTEGKVETFFDLLKPVVLEKAEDTTLKSFLQEHVIVKEKIQIALKAIKEEGVSSALLQRRLPCGYFIAGTIIDGLEALDIVTPFQDGRKRSFCLEKLESLQAFLNA